MKVLHIISSGGMYGAEAVILNMSRTLNEGSHTSTLGVFSNASNPNLQLHERARVEGIESNLIPCNGQIDRSAIACIQSLAARTQADIVHAHGFKGDVYAYMALRSSVPLISTCHNWLDGDLAVRVYGIVDRFILRKYARVVAVSDEVKQRLLKAGVAEEKVRLIRNGIDLRPFREATPALRDDAADDRLLVGLVGRLSREKGIDVFLNAMPRVLAEVSGTKFVIAGDGPDRDKIESLIDELKLRESVTMLGRRDDMPSVYASFDVMVSSSRQEGLPIAILEGMASGLPLVATAVGEVATLVQDGRTGILVPPEDVQALADGMVRLLRDQELRERMGTAARALIQAEFSAERMTADYLRVYEEALRCGF